MCAVNMAGRKCLAGPFDKIHIFGVFLAIFVINFVVSADQEVESKVLSVADTNWTLILEGEWMLLFYAPWCPACQQIKEEWDMFSRDSAPLDVSVGKVDVTQQPGLSGRFLVTTLPTIFHAKDGNFRRYLSSRTVEDFQSYITEKKWEVVEPVPGWKSPSSIVMTGMAGLFHLSVWIRQIHSYLTETQGLPAWTSYLIFAMATLLTGLILGLVLVLIADCLCPSRPRHKSGKKEEFLKDDLSEDEANASLIEEKRPFDSENENENEMEHMISGEESAGEEAVTTVGADDGNDSQQPEGATESEVRHRKPQGSKTAEEET
ncbi:thioredoxin-related transmembrane protein 4 [Anguilla rostrata]|uniref:thioredoxin-related transmembrane protein 4 n=1 Tax=Anguilla anguilla TaxID=7936 RepID=UPI0015A8873B|nr:thioredoxin-related transmembrane protein 4 [Anguilla anguilla]